MKSEEASARSTGAFVAAGVVLGAAWGLVAAQPAYSYLLALPGDDWPEVVCEWAFRILGGSGVTPPSRLLVITTIYTALVGGFAALLAPLVARLPLLGKWMDLPGPLAAGLVGFASILVLPLIWIPRGVSQPVVPLLLFPSLAAITCALIAPVLDRIAKALRARPAIAIAIPFVAIAALAVRAATQAPLRISPESTADGTGAHRVLLIGVDAASWDNLQPGLESGRLPTLERLLETGASGHLHATAPVFSPIIWTTMVTGVGREEHGIRDFTLDGVPYTSNSRTADAIWEILPEYGLRTAFHYWWASWPAEPVDGLVVSDRFLETALDRRVEPREMQPILDEMASTAFQDSHRVQSLVGGYPDEDFTARHRIKIVVVDQILHRDEVATRLGIEALAGDYDLVATYLRAPDAVGHKFWLWHLHDRHPTLARWIYGPPDRDQAVLGPLAERVYEVVDAQLARLLEAAGEDTNVMIVSDHGMTARLPIEPGPGEEPETGNHHRSGIVLLAGPDIRPGARIQGATVYDVFPTLLYLSNVPVPGEIPGRVIAEAIRSDVRGERPLARSTPRARRDVGDPTPIPTGRDEDYLEQLKALGYVVD